MRLLEKVLWFSHSRLFSQRYGLKCIRSQLFLNHFYALNLHTATRLECAENENVVLTNRRENYSSERYIFKQLITENPNYPSCMLHPTFLESNEQSANKLVLQLRECLERRKESKTPAEMPVLKLEDFVNESFTIDDLIEIYHAALKDGSMFNDLNDLDKLMCEKLLSSVCVKNIDKALHLQYIAQKLLLLSTLANKISFILAKHLKKLNKTQFIQLCYLNGIFSGRRFYSPDKNGKIALHIPQMNFHEVLLLGYGFFRAQKKPPNFISTLMIPKLKEGIRESNDEQAGIAGKILQYMANFTVAATLKEILNIVRPMIETTSYVTAIHLGSIGISVWLTDEKINSILADRCLNEMSNLRLKDIERTLLLFVTARIPLQENSDFVQAVRKILSLKTEEMHKYPESFIRLINFMICYGIYLDESIDMAMRELLQNLPKKTLHWMSELFFLDCCLSLERPDYKGNRLPQKLKEKLKYIYRRDPERVPRSLHLCLENILTEMYGEESHVSIYPLPHYVTKHCVLCVDSDGNPQAIRNKEVLKRSFNYAPKDGNIWVCFVFLRTYRHSDAKPAPPLTTEMKLRLMWRAGYTPVVIDRFHWKYLETPKKKEYLQSLVNKATNFI